MSRASNKRTEVTQEQNELYMQLGNTQQVKCGQLTHLDRNGSLHHPPSTGGGGGKVGGGPDKVQRMMSPVKMNPQPVTYRQGDT